MMKQITIMMAAMVAVTACTGSEVRNTLGLSRRSPDAFSVVSRPPLSMPKEFQLVEPGMEQGAGDTGIAADKTAKAVLLGESVDTSSSPDQVGGSGDLASEIRSQAGVQPSGEAVRRKINQETFEKEQNKKDESVIDMLQSGFKGSEDEVLNAEKEAQRLKAAKQTK